MAFLTELSFPPTRSASCWRPPDDVPFQQELGKDEKRRRIQAFLYFDVHQVRKISGARIARDVMLLFCALHGVDLLVDTSHGSWLGVRQARQLCYRFEVAVVAVIGSATWLFSLARVSSGSELAVKLKLHVHGQTAGQKSRRKLADHLLRVNPYSTV